MTEKISAGYFDSSRGEPIYVGDVYKENGAMIPYHKVIKDPEKGFMVEHVGTTEKFSLTSEAKNLIKREYLGNIFDTPDWDELVGHKKSEPEIQEVKNESLPENTPEDIKDFLEGKTDELPEGAETISTAEAEELKKQTEENEKATDENNSEVKTPDDTDAVVSADATTGPKEDKSENENKTVPEIVAYTKEEKQLLERKNDYQKSIDALKRKNNELETEAVRYENLASTLTFEPFVELKLLTSNAIQDFAKKQNIKECEKHLKNYKAIDSIESLLEEYEEMAGKNRANIDLNNKDIDNYEVKITEIQDKLRAFQTKLPLDSVTQIEEVKPETVEKDKPAEDIKATENVQTESEKDTTSNTDTDKKAEGYPDIPVDSEINNEEIPF